MTDELTVDQLAARTGLTVRNLRAYAARGLLPPPRMQGRTGYYGPEHVDRLVLVRSMLDEGYTLAKIEQTLAGQGGASTAASLALHRTLMAPWRPDTPEETDLPTLLARAGGQADAAVLEQVVQLGAIEVLEGDKVRVLDPTLLAAGLQVVRLGFPLAAVVEAQQKVVELVEQAADVYVAMARETVFRRFADAGAPVEDLADMQAIVERLQPAAAQALLASFRTAMASAINDAIDEELGRLPAQEQPD